MGRIEIIIGCMFSSKSSTLISIAKRYQVVNKKILLINHVSDTRYGKNIVSNHNGDKLDCISVNKLNDISDNIYKKVDVILIDEGQFFNDLFDMVTKLADNYNKTIIVAGLDGDSDRNPFGDITKLIPHAEKVKKLKAYCKICNDGTYAYFTKCLKNKESNILVGGSESYIAVCRNHFNYV